MNYFIVLCFYLISFASFGSTEHGPIFNEQIKKISEYEKPISENLPLNRPSSCPLSANADVYKDLSEKLIQLSNSFNRECKSNNQDLFNSLDSVISNINQFAQTMKPVDGQTIEEPTGPITDPNNLNSIANLQLLLGTVSSISQKAECVYDFKKNGALPIIADVIKNVTQLSVLIGGPVGIAAYAGGSIVTSTLYLIDGIIKSRFNWKTPEDRKAFIDTNCAYFDLRKELKRSGILDIITDQDQLDLVRYKGLEEQFKKMTDFLKIEFDNERNKIESNLSIYLNRNMKPKSYSLYLVTNKIIENAKKYKEDLGVEEIQTLLGHLNLDADLLAQGQFEQVSSSVKNLQAILNQSKILIKTLQTELEIDQNKFTNFISLVLSNAKTVKDGLASDKERVEKVWRELPHNSLMTNGKWYDDTLKDYKDLISRFNKVTLFYHQRVVAIENIFEHETHSNARVEINVLQSYQSIADNIYGKSGWRFFKYLLNNSIQRIEVFQSRFATFAPLYISNDYTLSDQEKIGGCQDAIALNIYWVEADKSIQSAIDFLDTNKELFNSFDNAKLYRNSKEKLQIQSNSLDQARNKSISGNFIKRNTIGDLIGVINNLKKNEIILLKKFIDDPVNRCRERFQH